MSDVNISQVISQLRSMSAAAQGGAEVQPQSGAGVDFSVLLKSAVEKVNDNQQHAGKMVEAYERGDTQADLTEVMIDLQKARVSFQAMVEVRNKLVSAYQDVMNMSI